MPRNLIYSLPLAVFALLLLAASITLFHPERKHGQALLVGKPAPVFAVQEFSAGDWRGRTVAVNFFSSWCPPCEAEFPALGILTKQYGVPLYGFDYKDDPEDLQKFLARLGNPYAAIAPDADGQIALAWGSTGVPATFIVDREGIIRYRHDAPLTPEDIHNVIAPLLETLK